MSREFPGLDVAFYEPSPLSSQAVQGRIAALRAGEHVASELIAVGRIVPGQATLDSLAGLALGQFNIADESLALFFRRNHFRDTPALGGLFKAFRHITQQDRQRGSLQGSEDIMVQARDYIDQTGWHIDPYYKQVRYTMSLGPASSTLGAIGQIGPENIDVVSGDVSLGMNLVPQDPFEPGTILRFSPGDAHSSPPVEERLAFFRSILHLS